MTPRPLRAHLGGVPGKGALLGSCRCRGGASGHERPGELNHAELSVGLRYASQASARSGSTRGELQDYRRLEPSELTHRATQRHSDGQVSALTAKIATLPYTRLTQEADIPVSRKEAAKD